MHEHNPSEDGVLMIGSYPLKFDPNELRDSYQEIAKSELRETLEVKQNALATLKELLKEVEDFHFPFADDEGDDILIQFLRRAKFYPQSALDQMKHFFAYMYNNPKLGRNLLRKDDLNVFEQKLINIVPGRDQHGRFVVVIEVGLKWDTKRCTVSEIIRGMIIMIQAAVIAPHNQIAGGTIIIDAQGLGLTHLLQFTPSLAINMLHYIQDCVPFRLKAIHIVNQAYFFNLIFAIFKPFLNQKLQTRIHFHGKDRSSLMKHVDAKALPAVYGGELDYPEISGAQMFDFVSYYKDNLNRLDACGYTKQPK